MISVWLVLWLIIAHWVADFLCQTDWMAVNKSHDRAALTEHATVYAAMMTGLLLPVLGWSTTVLFAPITFMAHWITDYYTSRITSRLWFFEQTSDKLWRPRIMLIWGQSYRHWFFVMIGLDQVLHYVQLLLTVTYLK